MQDADLQPWLKTLKELVKLAVAVGVKKEVERQLSGGLGLYCTWEYSNSFFSSITLRRDSGLIWSPKQS